MELGKILILIGFSITVIGFIIMFSTKFSFFGNLIGDIQYQNENMKIHLPFTSMIIISIILSFIINILYRLFR